MEKEALKKLRETLLVQSNVLDNSEISGNFSPSDIKPLKHAIERLIEALSTGQILENAEDLRRNLEVLMELNVYSTNLIFSALNSTLYNQRLVSDLYSKYSNLALEVNSLMAGAENLGKKL